MALKTLILVTKIITTVYLSSLALAFYTRAERMIVMVAFPLNSKSWVLACLCAALCMDVAQAQSGGSPTPGPQFQYAAMTGSGNTITLTRVPVVTSSGQTVYQDITLQFDNDGNGNLTLTSGFPMLAPSPSLEVSSFQTGKYVGPGSVANGNAVITVNGPGVVSGGSTAWSTITAGNADPCTFPVSMTWYVGPIDNNPMAARLKKASITSTAWSYGIGGNGIAFSCGGSLSFHWGNGSIIGVSQTGNAITFASFTNNGFDQASPVDQITYTLSQ